MKSDLDALMKDKKLLQLFIEYDEVAREFERLNATHAH